MQINKNRKGLALGAVFALVAGLFGGAAPASATVSTSAFTFTPAGGTSFAVINVEDFHMYVQRDPNVVSAADFNASFKYSITTNRVAGSTGTATTYSVAVVSGTTSGTLGAVSVSGGIASDMVRDYNTNALFAQQKMYYAGVLNATNTAMSATKTAAPKVATQSYVVDPGNSRSASVNNFIGLQIVDADTFSPTITVTVTAFLDLNGSNVWEANEPSATQTVTFLNPASVTRTVTVGALENGDTSFTASATITGVNTTQMTGKWALMMERWSNGSSADVQFSFSNPVEVTLTESPTGVSTFTQSVYTTSPAVGGTTVSAQLVYLRADGANGGNYFNASGASPVTQTANNDDLLETVIWPKGATITVTSAAAGSATTMYAVKGDNAVIASDPTFSVRPNSLVTIVASFSGVSSTSATTATFRFTGVTLNSTKTLSVNGGAAQNTGTHSAVTATVNASTGVASITVLPTGFGLDDNLVVHAKVDGVTEDSVTLDTVEMAYTLTRDATDVATAPSTAVEVGVTVKDQFGVKSARSDQRIHFYWSSGYSGTATNSYVALAAGVAKASMTPSRTPVTGSAVVDMQLQYLNGTVWTNQNTTVSTTVVVTNAANGFRTGLAASYSASISYGAAFSWSDAINAAYALVTGSQVVVSGPGLMFRDANGDTTSDTITLPGNNSGQVTFEVTARKAGSYPITLTAGSATTTSLIVVSPARSDAGASFTWDTTTIEAGKTRIVVGTLLDANGNPVDTTGPGTIPTGSTASILVSFTGTAGLVIGTMPTETDADGKFQVSVLTSAADRGTLNLTAAYYKAGASTAVADVVSSVNAITVGAASAAAPASDQKLTVGSFKGFVAIYALNYTGQKLSAKVAGKWLVVNELTRFQRVVRNTGAGYTIKVDLHIDGVFVRSETVVTK